MAGPGDQLIWVAGRRLGDAGAAPADFMAPVTASARRRVARGWRLRRSGPLLALRGPCAGPVAMLAISGLLSASLTSVSGILLATSTVAVGTILDMCSLRVSVLRVGQLAMISVPLIGVPVALWVWQLGLVSTPSPAIRSFDAGDLVLLGAGGVVCSG